MRGGGERGKEKTVRRIILVVSIFFYYRTVPLRRMIQVELYGYSVLGKGTFYQGTKTAHRQKQTERGGRRHI